MYGLSVWEHHQPSTSKMFGAISKMNTQEKKVMKNICKLQMMN